MFGHVASAVISFYYKICWKMVYLLWIVFIFIVCNKCIWKLSCIALIFIMVGVQDIKFVVHAHPTLFQILDELLKFVKVQSIWFKILILKYQILLWYCIGKRDGSTCFKYSILNGIYNQPLLKPVEAMMNKKVRKIGIWLLTCVPTLLMYELLIV
jgi:hypothetical protein